MHCKLKTCAGVLFSSNIAYLANAHALPDTTSVEHHVSSLNDTYVAYAEAALSTLQQWYNTKTGLWNTTGWWNSANCITVLADLAAIDRKVRSITDPVFNNTFFQAPIANGQMQTLKVMRNHMMHSQSTSVQPASTADHAFVNGYYDDEGWWTLAWIKAYDVTRQEQYLQEAIDIFDNLAHGATTPCSGGIWWDKKQTYVNAIANELYLSAAAHLANRVPSNSTYYLSTALSQWKWFQSTGMINPDSTIGDGLDSSCHPNHGTVWSYNQGVILGALVELAKATRSPATYIPTANAIATAAIHNLTDANGVLHDPCEPNCGADGAQFKGVFMRNLQLLQKVAPSAAYKRVIDATADSIWAKDRDAATNELSVVWSGPFIAPANASTQSSALDALVAAAAAAEAGGC